MATKVRVEWITLGVSPGFERMATNVLKSLLGTPAALTVTGTATASGSRPVAPTPSEGQVGGYLSRLYARVSSLDGNVVITWGADPTAAQDNGILLMAGGVEVLPVDPGQKLSFIELA